MSLLPHSLDQSKSGGQPRNELHFLMGRVAIVDTVIYCPDPCSRNNSLIPPSSGSVDCWWRLAESLHKHCPLPKTAFKSQTATPYQGPFQPTDSDPLPQLRRPLKIPTRFRIPVRMAKATLVTTLKLKFPSCPSFPQASEIVPRAFPSKLHTCKSSSQSLFPRKPNLK